jgi:hypothetical protein
MPMLSEEQIEAILARATEALNKRSPLRRLGYIRIGSPGRDWLDQLLRSDPEWRTLTSRQQDMIGLRFWQRIEERGARQRGVSARHPRA